MIVEFITGPDDFTIGTKLVYYNEVPNIDKHLSYSVYEVISPPDYRGIASFKSYTQRHDQASFYTKVNHRVEDFRPLNNWRKIMDYMPYDPKQQGETSDDI